MATITVLADIIIPKDGKSGSASDAKVPEFIEFIVKDIPSHKLPMRGGLKWLDMQCLNRYGKPFIKCSSAQQTQLLDLIAYPELAKAEMAQGVAFFNRMRDLTASGFWSILLRLTANVTATRLQCAPCHIPSSLPTCRCMCTPALKKRTSGLLREERRGTSTRP